MDVTCNISPKLSSSRLIPLTGVQKTALGPANQIVKRVGSIWTSCNAAAFSPYLPEGDPIRRELESLYPPFVKA